MTRNETVQNDILLVPSAVIVPDELRLDVGSIPAGMVSLQGKPMLDRIAEAYAEYDVTNVVAVDEAAESIRQYASRSDHDWTIVDVSGTESLAETIEDALNAFDPATLEGLYVNFADTLISPIPSIETGDYVPYCIEDRTYRWTTFEIVDREIGTVTEKYEQISSDPRPTFVGQFGISDAAAYRETLIDTGESSEMARFYAALLAYLADREYELYQPEQWLDVGHLDTYHRAKKQFLNAREFNELSVDSEKNVITKRSEDASTLIDEISWYNEMPTELQPYLPRLYEWSTDEQPYVEMEYVGYPSLSDLQLYGSHGQHIWNTIFHRLFQMLEEFREYTVTEKQAKITDALESIYIEKTRRRLRDLQADPQFERFFDAESVTVNGTEYPSVNQVLDRLASLVDTEGLLSRETFSIIHGDLCLPNILYDPRNQIIKLIDPRGQFGEFTIYGDPRYDFAKLRHSFVGHYEHLINGQFDASATETAISYNIYVTEPQQQREERFDAVLEEQTDVSLRSIKLIEALLFLSMTPLHDDSHERQLCMLGEGLEKIAPYLE